MALYFGGEKLKLNLGGYAYKLNILTKDPSATVIRLLSSDGKILKDSVGLYLMPREGK